MPAHPPSPVPSGLRPIYCCLKPTSLPPPISTSRSVSHRRLIAREEGAAVELDQVWRFHQRWERDASLRLRHADVDVINLYHQHGRVHGGPRDQMLDRAFSGWAAARQQGRSVIVTATDRNTRPPTGRST